MTLILPTGEMALKIKKELKENETTRDSDIQHMKTWLRQQPHLPDTWDDIRILSFLRGCSFSLEKCKKKLDMYFTMRTAAPEFFSNRNMHNPDLQEALTIMQMPPLPNVTPDGRRICLLRAVYKEGAIPNITAAMKAIMMIGDIRMAEETEGVSGDIYIFDSTYVTLSHLALAPPTLVKKFFMSVQDSFPVKVKQVHLINISPAIDAILTFCKPFLKEKLRKRIFFHSNLKSLYKHVPKEIMPEEYGGKAGSVDDIHKAWIKKMCSYTNWFKEQENFKADESKRPGKPKTHDDLFGTEGSFRKLIID